MRATFTNRQLYHINLKLSLQLHTFFCYYCLFCPISILLYTLNSTLYFVKSELKMREELSKQVLKSIVYFLKFDHIKSRVDHIKSKKLTV